MIDTTNVRTVPVHFDPVRRDAKGALKLKGHAAVYNSPSVDIGFREVLLPGCFKNALSASDTDVFLYWSHDRKQPLGRQSAGNLRVWEDAKGLAFEVTLPDTTLARDAIELVRQGIVKQMSFGFIPDPANERIEKKGGETWVYVSSVRRLFEISLVGDPAYQATSVTEARSAARDAIRLAQITARDRSDYGPDSEHSFFRDLATIKAAIDHTNKMNELGLTRIVPGHILDTAPQGFPDRVHGGLREAQERIAKQLNLRDVASTGLAGEVDIMNGVPEFVVTALGKAVRARALLANAIEQTPLPKGWIAPASWAQTNYVSTGAVAAPQVLETDAATSTDIAGTAVALKPAMIFGEVTLSRALVDRGVGVDVLIARELGGAIGASLEAQVIDGTGASGQLTGIRTIASTIGVTYTDGTPTVAELWAPLLQLRSKVAEGSGEIPAIVAMRPRRWSWINAALDGQQAWAAFAETFSPDGDADDVRLIETLGIGSAYGAGTEDIVVILTPEALLLAIQPERLNVKQVGAEKITFAGWRYAALVTRQPKGVGILSGTGLAAPAGF